MARNDFMIFIVIYYQSVCERTVIRLGKVVEEWYLKEGLSGGVSVKCVE